MTLLAGKVAIVTGAGRGIGAATAKSLASHGARVVLADIDSACVQEVAECLEWSPTVVTGDLTQSGEPERLVASAVETWGRLDIIVNNAGYTFDAPIHRMSADQFQAMLDVHTILPFRVLRAAAPHLRGPAKRERERGVEVFRKVVNISSVAGTMGNPGQANYASAKASIIGLTKTLAKEWGPLKINVNAVAFGFVETRLTATKEAGNTVAQGGREIAVGVPREMLTALGKAIPIGRPGTSAEAAAAITFLCVPWSNYAQGQVLHVTGGLQLGMAG